MSHSMFREHFRVPGFMRGLADEIARHSRCLNHLYGVGGAQVTPNVFGGFDVEAGDGAGEAQDTSSFPFGWMGTTGSRAIIRQGIINTFGRMILVGNPETEVQVSGNESTPHIVYAENDRVSGARIVEQSVAMSAWPGNTADTWRMPLHLAYLRQGQVVFVQPLHVGVWAL